MLIRHSSYLGVAVISFHPSSKTYPATSCSGEHPPIPSTIRRLRHGLTIAIRHGTMMMIRHLLRRHTSLLRLRMVYGGQGIAPPARGKARWMWQKPRHLRGPRLTGRGSLARESATASQPIAVA